jgi:glucose dehydrogenase
MRARPTWLALTVLGCCALVAACGSSAPAEISTPTAGARAIPAATSRPRATLRDWPTFGLDAQRSGVSEEATGITSANLGRLRAVSVTVPGTVDSSPVYLHAVRVAGALHDVVLATTSYGRTVAIDAATARLLWTFTPPGLARWAGSSQITTASPIADPDRRFVYAASPDGRSTSSRWPTVARAPGGRWRSRGTRPARRSRPR